MGRKLLKINDSAWLFAESHRTPMQVGMLATLPRRPRASRPSSGTWSRAGDRSTFKPPVQLPVQAPRRPRVGRAPTIGSTSSTTSATPRCRAGGERELGVLVSRLHSHRLHRAYPLWEVHLIEGLGEQALRALHEAPPLAGRRRRRDPDARADAGRQPQGRAITPAVGDRHRRPRPVRACRAEQSATAPAPARARVAAGRRRDGPGPAIPGRGGRDLRPGVEAITTSTPRRRSVRGADDRLQQAHPRPAPFRHPALRARPGQGGGQEGRGHAQRRLRGHLRRRPEALPQGAGRAARAVADRRAAGVGPAGGRRRRGQRDHLHPHQALHRHRGSRGPPGGDPRVHAGTPRNGCSSAARRGDGQLHAADHGPVPGAGRARARRIHPPVHNLVSRTCPGRPSRSTSTGARLEELYPCQPAVQRPGAEHLGGQLRRLLQPGLHRRRDTLPSMQRLAVYTGEELEELEATLG